MQTTPTTVPKTPITHPSAQNIGKAALLDVADGIAVADDLDTAREVVVLVLSLVAVDPLLDVFGGDVFGGDVFGGDVFGGDVRDNIDNGRVEYLLEEDGVASRHGIRRGD
jgi:hypothetical protein